MVHFTNTDQVYATGCNAFEYESMAPSSLPILVTNSEMDHLALAINRVYRFWAPWGVTLYIGKRMSPTTSGTRPSGEFFVGAHHQLRKNR